MELSVTHRAIPARPRVRRGESGAAMLEFALVAPIFFFILYALVVFGMALALKQSVTNAAAEGARSTVGVVDNTATPADERVDNARDVVLQRLGWLSSSQKASLTINPTIATCSVGTGTCITVQVTYPYDANPLVPSAPIIKQIQPKTVGSTATVRLN
jgi:Flp pilus assembly protein TadG